MINRRKFFKKVLRKAFSILTVFAVIFSSMGPAIMPVPVARAVSAITASMEGLPTQMPGEKISANSFDMPILKISVTASQAGQTLQAVTANFSGTGFAAGDLAVIATDGTSGVALYDDTNNNGFYNPGGTDNVITLAASPDWTPATTNITLTPAAPFSLPNGTAKVFFLVIKTSATISNNDQIIATIPANAVITSDGNGPVSNFSSNYLLADTTPVAISTVSGAVGSATLNVKFSKPVRKAGAGFNPIILADTPFTFTDNGTVNTHTITAVSHTAGQDFVQVTLSAALDSGDLDGTPSTIAAGADKISDMGGVVVGTGAVAVSNPLNIITASIPSTVVGTNYTVTSPAPLVTFTAGGGSGTGYTWAAAAAGDGTILANLGLSLTASGADAGKLVGTVLNVPGSYSVNIKVTDSALATSTKMFNINVAPSGGGGIPGISSVTPGGGPKGAVSMPITVTGVNTHFSGSSTVQFWKAGANDADMTVTSIASSSATSLTFNLAIAAGATEGTRDVKITTGAEQATMPNGFNVFASGGSGLGLLMPSDAATGVQMPPTFNFDPSTNGTINSYRIDLNTTSNFAGTTLWDYVFPKPADIGNSNNSHCNSFGCNTSYGEGRFMILTPPTPLAPNTTYYWRVRTYAESPSSTISSATAVESTSVRSFTTTASMSDVEPPMIMHRPIFQATASTNLNVIARVMDNLATATSMPALTTSLFYCAGAACSPTTEVASASLGAGYYKYIIPSATIGVAGTIVRYYISATDGTNTRSFKQPDGTTPFQLTSVAAGSANSITGNVKDNSNANLTGALVFAEGTGFLSAATDGTGNFTLGSNNLFAGTYDLVAIKEGYGDPMINGIPAGSTGIQFRLGQGFGGGFGGDTAKPRVKFTGPMDGMNGVPGNDLNFKVFVAFDKAMSQSKFTEAGNMLVKKITDFSTNPPTTADVAGSWVYYSTNPGIPMLPPEGNLAVFTPSVVFGENKTILVSVTSSITDTAGNSVQSNQSDGSYSFMFTTGSNVTFSGNTIVGGTFGQGAFMPPHVTGTMPSPGAFEVPRNSKVIINFSDPMADDGGGYVLKNNVKLYTVAGGTETDVSASAINTVLLDSAKTGATVALLAGYNSGTFAASTVYRLKVLGGAKAASGMTIAPPDQAANPMFTAEFKTSATSDTAAPNIVGSYPSAGDTSTPVNIGAVSVGFSKDMDVSTITTSTVYLSIGSTAVNGVVEYRGVERQALFIPSTVLNPNTTYTINVTTDVKGINGVAIAATAAQPLTRNFTTNGADSVTPEIMFMNADDYATAITFSEPMNAAKATDTLNWSTSVLNPAVYNVIKYGAAGFDPSAAGTVVPLTTATLKYDAASSTLMIEGLALTIGQELYLSMDITGAPGAGAQIARDLSGNGIATPKNIARAPIKDSALTKGALGPMAMGGSAFEMGGGFVPTNFSSGTFGFAPSVEVMPFNKMAGQTTIYGVRIPISQQILAGGMVVLTFPTGFDVAGAKQDINSPMRTDLNGPGTGTVTFKCLTNVVGGKSCSGGANANDTGAAQGGLADDGVVINPTARTVTIYLSANTRSDSGDTHDFLTIDIAGIKNSTVPKDFNTSGYTIDIKTKNSDTLLESLTSMPFFIQGATGTTYTLNGTITAAGVTGGTMKVYLMSPMTGPMEQEITFGGGGTAAYSFAGIPSGGYGLFTDQYISLTGGNFSGKTFPENFFITADKTYDFTLTSATSGTAVVVNITGGPASEPMDIFASSPTGFRAKQITLNGAGAGTATLNLPDGQWYVGAGPQMPKGPMSGPPPAPGYLPPKPLEIKVANPAVTENSDVANDGTIVFALTTSTKQIKGLVQDGTGKTMANAEVFAYSPQGGFGTNAKTDSNGSFTLRVSDGIYVVGAFIPGMPPSKEVSVSVTSDPATYLLINGSATAITPAAAATSFVLKVAKPDYTISGKVTDGTNVVQGASVYAYRTNGPGHANAITDSSGNYTLYVSGNTTWKVGTFLPQYGNLTELDVAVTTANVANQNFTPTQTGTFRKVSGTVTSGGAPVQGAFVSIRNSSTSNEAITAPDGTYSFNVPVGTGYIIRATIPGVGETVPLAAFDVAGSDIAGKNITSATARLVTITFTAAPTKAFVELASATGIRNRVEVNNATTATLSVPDGDYNVKVDVPGTAIGLSSIAATDGTTVYSNTTGIVAVNGAEGLTVTLPTTRTLTGTVKVGLANLADAWVEIFDPANGGVHFGAKADANGAFSMVVADGSYMINAMKPGYYRNPTALTVDGATAAQTITVVAASTTIEGTIYIGASGAANAFVRAEKQGGGFAGTQADANGVYKLYVTSGVWRVYAVAEGYAETAYASNPIDVTSGSVVGKNITVSTAVNVPAPKSKSITPANGGTLEDTATGIKLTFPGSSLGTSTSSGNVEAKETNNVRETSTAKPLKSLDSTTSTYINSGKTITATVVDSTGSSTAVSTLGLPATIEMSYTKAELAATSSATDASIDSKAEADAVKMGYWDESSASWVTQPTTITYKDASGNVIADVTAIDTAPEFAATVATVIISATTDHLSLYAPVSTVGSTPPATPAGLAATAANSSQIDLTWTAASGATGYDIYRSTTSGGTFTRVGSEPTVGAVTAYSDSTGLSASTAYYYKITSLNATGESAASSEVTATTSAASSSQPSGGGGGGDTTPPGDVTSVVAAVDMGKVTLTWVKPTNSDFSSIRIYRSTVSGTKGNLLASGITGVTYTDNAVTNGTTYYYTIHAVDNSGNENTSTIQYSAVPGTPSVTPTPTPTPGVSPTPTPLPGPATPAAVSGVTLYRVEGDSRVYVIKEGKKNWIKTAEDFVAAGYKWSDIIVTSAGVVASYPDATVVGVMKVKVVGTPTLRVRKSNTTKSSAIGSVKKNETFTVLEQIKGWYKITTSGGLTGWISGAYTEAVAESVSAPQGAVMVIVVPQYLRIRSINSASGKMLGLVKKGEVYSALEEKSGWYKIKTSKGVVGWISGEYATKQ